MFDWEEGDRFSFEDSDRFEEDSLCSWISEPESLCNNWRGWKKNSTSNGGGESRSSSFAAAAAAAAAASSGHHSAAAATSAVARTSSRVEEGQVLSLVELAAREVACHIPFEVVEHVYPPVPEQLQLRIACWSFPENEEDIRLYSCLANGSADEFIRGEHMFKGRGVKDPLQIGFHLSATVVPPATLAQIKGYYNVAVTFDRRRITSCNCTCSSSASWCAHVVAVCLHRIHQSNQVCLRAPVSESLSRLRRDQLQKFAQYLISELPQQILPTAQRLLDELLSCQQTAINTVCGAPDPTAGASCSEQTTWCLDEATLHENIRKILIKFCVPSPIVFSDVNYLSSTAPPAAAEWSSLLRPLRGREPEGMWNLLSIVREMYRRNDRNAMLLLEILTEECLACEQILVWWFNTRVSLHNGNLGGRGGINSNTHASQHACSSLCDEIVVLWRLAALNPALSPPERKILSTRLKDWHLKTIEKVCKVKGGSNNGVAGGGGAGGGGVGGGGVNNGGNNGGVRKADIEIFAGFKSSIEACLLDWDDYPIQGVTYAEGVASRYYLPYCSGRHQESHVREVTSSSAVISGEHQPVGCTTVAPNMKHSRTVGVTHCHRGIVSPHHLTTREVRIVSTPLVAASGLGASTDGNRSSISSEGFCENEAEGPSSDSVDEFFRSPGPITNAALAKAMKFVFAEKDQMNGSSGGVATDILEVVSVDSSSSSEKAFVCGGGSLDLENLQPIDLVTCHVGTDASMASTPLTTSSTATTTMMAMVATQIDAQPTDDMEKLSPDDTDSDLSSAPESDQPIKLIAIAAVANKSDRSEQIKCEHSESQQSSDECQVYYYDSKAKATTVERQPKERKQQQAAAQPPQQQQQQQQAALQLPQPPPQQQQQTTAVDSKPEENSIFSSIKRNDDPLEILFARAEALHAHGHTKEACKLGVKLAEELLVNPPDLMIELPPPPTKGKRKKKVNPASHQISCLASATLAKTAFLCTVLSENAEHTHVAFKVGLYGLEMARPPASTKALEVKLANQESDLVALLKRIPLGPAELRVIREKAEMLRDGKLTCRGDALLPMNLTSFIFDALCLSNSSGRGNVHYGYRLPTDESLGFEAAVAALGLKANVSEADHPLLCEGTRRQRGDLALTLLVHYKDDQDKLAKHIMDKLLDKEIHQMYKTPVLNAYYASKPTSGHGMSCSSNNNTKVAGQTLGGSRKETGTSVESDDVGKPGTFCSSSNSTSSSTIGLTCVEDGTSPDAEKSIANLNLNGCPAIGAGGSGSGVGAGGSGVGGMAGGARAKESLCHHGRQRRCADDKRDDTSSPTWEEDYKAWEAKFRCTNFRTHKKHSAGMASIDSSAPETTSSDNSPTLIRRTGWGKPVGPGSDSGSSGKSSDSFGSSSSGDKAGRNKIRENESPPPNFSIMRCQNLFGNEMVVRSVTPCIKNTRFKGKRSYPSVPNQPSEASAHFMFELAKTVLAKAGGNSSTSLFTQPTASQNHRGPHRPLHICAFQIGLYALGLHNRVSPNWLSRTYSSHVSWITSQALEIGSAAISFLIDTWEGHLTPPEVASLADRASRGRDPNMVGTASELALSCLPHAHALNPNEIQRAIMQCKEQNNEMLERACLAVESAAKGGGVYPEVLFDVARRWYELYKETLPGTGASPGRESTHQQQQQQQPPPLAHRMSDPGTLPKMERNNGGGGAVECQNMPSPPSVAAPCSNQDNRMPSSGTSSATASPEANLDPPPIAFVPCLQSEGLMQQPPLPAVMSQVPVTVTVAHNLPYGPPLMSNAMGMPFAPACTIPYSYIPNFTPHYHHHQHQHQQQLQQQQQHQQHQQHHMQMQPPLPPHHAIHPFVTAPFPYPNQPTFSIPAYYGLPTVTVASQMRTPAPPPLPPMYANQLPVIQNGQQRPGGGGGGGGGLLPGQSPNQNPLHNLQNAQQGCGHPQQQAAPAQVRTPVTPINQNQLNYLLSTYRVGMLALEMLARRVHDDRPNAKYARNPSYGEDVKWLLNVAKKLGTSYVQQFCICTVGSVASPFLLQEITWDAAHYLARNNPAPLVQHLRSPVLTPLVQKCQQMYIQCTHMKMFHLTPTEYEDFVGIIRSARTAFQMTPGGMVQFNEFLQALRRSKTCKKDLWQRIASVLQSGSV